MQPTIIAHKLGWIHALLPVKIQWSVCSLGLTIVSVELVETFINNTKSPAEVATYILNKHD